MTFDEKTRKLTSDTGYIHALDDLLYTDYSIYLGIYDAPENYEEGNKTDFEAWEERQKENIPHEEPSL